MVATSLLVLVVLGAFTGLEQLLDTVQAHEERLRQKSANRHALGVMAEDLMHIDYLYPESISWDEQTHVLSLRIAPEPSRASFIVYYYCAMVDRKMSLCRQVKSFVSEKLSFDDVVLEDINKFDISFYCNQTPIMPNDLNRCPQLDYIDVELNKVVASTLFDKGQEATITQRFYLNLKRL